ncbi:hypothetical protein MSSAC_2700 [Methanosarcina siciliae C2J]|uniref:MrfA-like Zn-binding domain-containing protein n=1 Tax=Methanosarcina siciliae C2J TaxID=1434118 RepID=A0A0E3PRG2_9EURY|nr:DUF1998 domain-containing protein [Methanosarcina siciliae]AKB37290.1 hypothetical protein MSSAC_2700 [Methanosarcina siciliae C2J]
MLEKVQHIRRSQFITTYGPGAIIEGRKGPRVIPSLDIGLGKYFSQEILEEFEIPDIRMTYLVNGASIFSLPTNAALKKKDSLYIYRTKEFPVWRICANWKKHKNPDSILYEGNNVDFKCPVCGEIGEPVRFILACADGHMDDIPWNTLVHEKEKGTNCKGWFYWKGGGSSVKSIEIECPTCNQKKTVEEIYKKGSRCTGRLPEREFSGPYRPKKCGSHMKVIQRQATNLRIPEVLTLLTIPEYDTRIARIIQGKSVLNLIENLEDAGVLDEENFMKGINKKLEREEILKETFECISYYISKHNWKDFLNLYQSINPKSREDKCEYKDMLIEEFRSLKNSSEIGYISDNKNFSIRKSKEFMLSLHHNEIPLKVAGIDVLRTVTVQRGYRRMPNLKVENHPECNSLVPIDVKIPSSGEKWLPGFESIGEGIFITASKNPAISLAPISYDVKIEEKDSKNGGLLRDVNVKDPLFIWWHTLSHALIRTLSLYSGYSSSSLKERVYLDDSKGVNEGGILIYTTMSGNDGGMGGLTGTISNFEEVLTRTLESIALCSNDPLCIEQKMNEKSCNGSACHSCLLVSETSCEHRNMWLDRHMILGD